jgi:uncharacterized membrane protein
MSLKYYKQFVAGAGVLVLLWFVRFLATGSLMYAFLLWNLFLAAIPLIITHFAVKFKLSGNKLLALTILWLAFLPNAPYIITDLYHLDHLKAVAPQLWYDPLMTFVAAYMGLKMGFISVNMMERQWRETLWQQWFKESSTTMRWRIRQVLLVGLFTAVGFGMYAGRVLRWNSWDIVHRPLHLIEDVTVRLVFPQEHLSTWAFTILYGFVLFVLYGFSGKYKPAFI